VFGYLLAGGSAVAVGSVAVPAQDACIARSIKIDSVTIEPTGALTTRYDVGLDDQFADGQFAQADHDRYERWRHRHS
jgi:hypothetical protein